MVKRKAKKTKKKLTFQKKKEIPITSEAEICSQELLKILNGDLPLDFNWNSDPHPASLIPKRIIFDPSPQQLKKVIINDEALRDGLHGVDKYPSVQEMLSYMEAAYELGIRLMTVGIYSGDGVVNETTKKLLKKMSQKYAHVSPIVLSLATESSLRWAADCRKLNSKLQVIVFMGSSPSRMLVEGWTKNLVLRRLKWAVAKAVKKYKLTVIGATEHTTQTPPDFLRKIIRVQIENGAKFFCIADTIGTARPVGAFRLVRFVRKVLDSLGANRVLIDWHGHRDIGLAVPNCLAAVAAGVNRVHLVPWGIGERAGNAALEVFLINAFQIMQEKGYKLRWDLSKLSKLLEVYAQITNNVIPYHGCLSQRAFATSLGIHTAAILKGLILAQEARKKGHPELALRLEIMANQVYSGVGCHLIGRQHQISIGPYSGFSTVKVKARLIGLKEPPQQIIEAILTTAKKLRRQLTDEEFWTLINGKN